jgi:CIC family chloride channel protein
LIVGAGSGLVAAWFRLALERADALRTALVGWAHGGSVAGFALVVVAAGAVTATAAFLVRRFFPDAVGSGIPQVEVVVKGEVGPASAALLPVKFAGGLLAIGAGLALGREGPSVQMGANVAHLCGGAFRRNAADRVALIAAGAGAGLATAFNAPLAGAVFVLEELVRRFDARHTIATLGASAMAIVVAQRLLGHEPDFTVAALPFMPLASVPLYLALGVVAGVLGTLYSRTILLMLSAADRLDRWPVELRAGAIGALVGAIAWFAPGMVGGGDGITQRVLAGEGTAGMIALLFLFRFCLGAVSYASGTPGGLFAPMLVLGAQIGLVFGMGCALWLPRVASHPTAFAVIGMAAFFAAVVRAPVTGIVLVVELTGSTTLLLPALGSSFAAMAVATLQGVEPIYDSLGARLGRLGAPLSVDERGRGVAPLRPRC